jgi:hypothetical protein
MATPKVKVLFGKLTQPLIAKNVNAQTTLFAFCEQNGIEYGSSVRVNGKTSDKQYTLQEGDIITSIDNIDGGK